MSIDRVAEFLTRLFLLGAFLLLALAVAEKIANLLGQTITAVTNRPSDLAMYATMLAVFAIALLLVGIKNELRK
jgi:small neutral amino acid transporter SnatA (MarC family)